MKFLQRRDLPGQLTLGLCIPSIPSVDDESPRGDAVYTRPEVVRFILDLCGYVAEYPLWKKRLLEPSFGGGDFLVEVVERLFTSWDKTGPRRDITVADLEGCVRAVELNGRTYRETRAKIFAMLERRLNADDVERVLDKWLVNADFLLLDFETAFDFVVGNPPYIRLEKIASELTTQYRQRHRSLTDRADIYVAFYEYSLRLLSRGGVLGFICADRWMKNSYGQYLRQFVTSKYNLRICVDMSKTEAFHSEVTAYPAITVIANEPSQDTVFAANPEISDSALTVLAEKLRRGRSAEKVKVLRGGSAPWIVAPEDAASVLERMERAYPSLEDAGCKVGIGVASGADKVFIAPFDGLPVEPERKLRLVRHADFCGDDIVWGGYGIVNPFDTDGRLVRLTDWPRFAAWAERNREVLALRHCAHGCANGWYKTIDRIVSGLSVTPKLLIPDLNTAMRIGYDAGEFYPHHNLYYVVSDTWDLRALRTVLASSLFRATINAYAVKMRGDCLRFQAQYLRRFHIPKWDTVPDAVRQRLIDLFDSSDLLARDDAVAELFNCTFKEVSVCRDWLRPAG